MWSPGNLLGVLPLKCCTSVALLGTSHVSMHGNLAPYSTFSTSYCYVQTWETESYSMFASLSRITTNCSSSLMQVWLTGPASVVVTWASSTGKPKLLLIHQLYQLQFHIDFVRSFQGKKNVVPDTVRSGAETASYVQAGSRHCEAYCSSLKRQMRGIKTHSCTY